MQQRKRKRKTMINTKTVTKRVANSRKPKKCKTRITKIKIMTTKKVINNCNKERGERRR